RTVGRGTTARGLDSVAPHVSSPNRVVYQRPGLSEWYANSPLGLEQGFAVTRRPAGQGSLTLTVGLSGSLAATAAQHGQTISFGSLVYRGLVVTDARGHTLPAHLQLVGSDVLIRVRDRTARYPVHVDPFFQVGELTASDGAPSDYFGQSVAIDGDTIAAGAYGRNSFRGAVYVFTKPGGGWADATQTAELTASDAAAGSGLGHTVAERGDTVTAGPPTRAVGGNPSRGAVYVFTKPGGGWTDATQTAELTASDGTPNDQLGFSIAVSGDTITSGAPNHA